MGKSIETLHAFRGWEKSLTAAWPADADHPQDEWVIGAIDEEGNKYDVITVDANQYDAPGDSEKIARALIALLAQAFSELQPDNHVEEVRTLVEPAPAQDEPLYVTHGPLIRNAIGLLGMRRPVAPDVQHVIDDLEMMLKGMTAPSAPAEAHWLEVAEVAARPPQTDQQPEQSEVVEALGSMTCAYRMAIQAGHARITALGGECDSVERMLADFPNYGKAVELYKSCRTAKGTQP